jgi:YbbR domain-containing protein
MAWHPFRNIGLKVAALGLGTVLWFTISGQQVERTVRAPIEYVHVPTGLEITGDQTDTILVHVRGADNQISRIAPGDVRVVLDLADVHAMVHGTLALRTDQVLAPFGVEVMHVDPPQVTLTLEASASLRVRVVPDIAGTPVSGFVIGGFTVDPATVEVVGPESQLRQLDHATTARLSVDGAASTITQSVSITVPDSSLRLRGPQVAHVTITIVKRKDIKK